MGNVTVKNPLMIASGSGLKLKNKSVYISRNGTETFNAQNENVDGYKSVTVYVDAPEEQGYFYHTGNGGIYLGTNTNHFTKLFAIDDSVDTSYYNGIFEIEDGCKTIANDADFSKIKYLNTLIIPASVTSINCDLTKNYYLTKIYYLGTLEQWCSIDFGSWAGFPDGTKFYVNHNDNQYYVTEITHNDFSNYSTTNTIDISSKAFVGYSHLDSIRLNPSGQCTITIGNDAFFRSSVYRVELRSYHTIVETQAFQYAKNLTQLTISNFEIGDRAFQDCYRLSSPEFILGNLDHTYSLGNAAFMHCQSIESVDLYNFPITRIPHNVFDGCENLYKLRLPSQLESIGYCALGRCPLLATITIPSTVTSMDSWAFYSTYIYEIVNLSDLPLIVGSSDYPGLTDSADHIVQDINESTIIEHDGAYYDITGSGAILVSIIPKEQESIYSDFYSRSISPFLWDGDLISIAGACNYFRYKVIKDRLYQIILLGVINGTLDFSYCNSLCEVYNESSANIQVQSSVVQHTSRSEDSIIRRVDGYFIAANNYVVGWAYNYFASTISLSDQNIIGFNLKGAQHFVPKELDLSGTNIIDIKNIPYGTKILKLPATVRYCGTIYSSSSAISADVIYYQGDIAGWIQIGNYDGYYVPRLNDNRHPIIIANVNTEQVIEDTIYINGEMVTNIIVPNTVTKIPVGCFQNCNTISSLSFESGSTCTTISADAFRGCKNLTDIDLPQSITTIMEHAFKDTNIKALRIPDTSSTLTIAKTAFECDLNIVYSDNSKYQVLSNSNCIVDTSDNNRVVIGTNYFTFPSSSLSVSPDAFSYRSKIESMVCPLGILRLTNCTSLKVLDYTGASFSSTRVDMYSNDNGLDGCTSLRTIIYPDTLTTIANYTFTYQGPYNLSEIYLPNPSNVVQIGDTNVALHYINLTVYVPANLVESYQNDSSWQVYENITFKAIPTV